MSTPRFYCAPKHCNLAMGAIITLPERAAIHASRALRLKAGDGAILFNGDGNDYIGELLLVKKNVVTAKVKAVKKIKRESPLKVLLAQAISSGDRMDFTIQKAVEMGVTAIQPIAGQRSVVKLSAERAEKRREHWQNIVISACEQSGRAIVPEVAAPLTLADWLSATPSPYKGEGWGEGKSSTTLITLSPNSTQTLQDLPKPTGEICLLIGCEGGLTENELGLATTHDFTPVRLGNRILRTETAALAALAAMQTLWGDYNS